MQLSDRNSRLVLVGTGIGFFGYIMQKVIEVVKNSFSEIYINSFPIGAGHILSSILFSNTMAILGLGIWYCYFELHNYGNYDKEESSIYISKADKYYRLLLKFSYTSFFMILVFSFILLQIIPLIAYFPLVSLLIVVSLFILFIFITLKRWKREWFKKTYSYIQGLKKFSMQVVIFFIWVVTLPSTMILGIDSNLNTQFKISFNHEKVPKIEFAFDDHVPDQMPNNIVITLGIPSGLKELKLSRDDFTKSLTEVTKQDDQVVPLLENIDGKSLIVINKSNYKFKKTLTLQQLVGVNKGYVEIRFDTFDTSKRKRSYRLANEFVLENGKVLFNQDQFNIDLK